MEQVFALGAGVWVVCEGLGDGICQLGCRDLQWHLPAPYFDAVVASCLGLCDVDLSVAALARLFNFTSRIL